MVYEKGFNVSHKNTADEDRLYKISSLFKAEPVYEGGLNIILLLQVSSYDF